MSDMMLLEPLEIDVTKSKACDGWDYKPVRWAWLAASAWWLLRKLGAVKTRMTTVKAYRFRAPEASKSINDAVFRAIKERVRHGGLANEYAVVMGHETFRDLMRDSQDLRPMGSQVFQFRAGPFGYRGEMFSVPVHVVETVKGVALIPRVIIEKSS